MKDILTPEQRARQIIYRYRGFIEEEDQDDLLSIIDSLQPKQYTEEELRAEFEQSEFNDAFFVERWQSWLACARFIGVLKE